MIKLLINKTKLPFILSALKMVIEREQEYLA
jgi:hypothetical protein